MLSAGRAEEAIKQYYHLKTRIALINKDIWYNKECLRNNVIPRYVGIKTQTHSKAAKKATDLGRIIWVKNEIKNLYGRKQNLYDKVYRLHLEIGQIGCKDKLELNRTRFLNDLKVKMNNKQIGLDRKLTRLLKDNNKQWETNDRRIDKHEFYEKVKNLTEVEFSKDENILLSKGLKYNMEASYKDTNNLKQTIGECENALLLVEPRNRNHARHLILEKLNQVKNQPVKINIGEKRSLRRLETKMKDNEIMAVKADKGNTTVLIHKADYIDKTLKFIEDNRISELQKDPTSKYQTNIKNELQNIMLIMDSNEKKRMINMNPKAPNLRAMPKIHKQDIPIRPIVNFRNAPGYKISNFLQSYLKENINLDSENIISSSKQMVDKLKELKINKDTRFMSIDCINMYTNIPVKDTIKIVKTKLIENNVSLNEVKEVTKLLKLVLGQNYFKFNNKVYTQKEGLAMGSPLSGLLANIFINNIEKAIVRNVNDIDNEATWNRYVDDVLISYNSMKIKAEEIKQIANSINNNIQFTEELEKDNVLNYLDLKLERNDEYIKIGIHRKPTTTSHAIRKESCHPEEHKQAAIRSHINRALRLPNCEIERNKEFEIIYQIAEDNGYNRQWVDNIRNKVDSKKEQRNNNNEDKKYASFTYINNQTHKITQVLRNKFKLNIAYKTDNKLGRYIGKHDLNNYDKYNNSGIYKLTCKTDGCGCFYYGQTGRSFNCRFKEHKMSVRHNRGTAFGNHAYDNDHAFGTISENLDIIKRENKGMKMTTRECMEIYLNRNNPKNLNEQMEYSNVLFSCLEN